MLSIFAFMIILLNAVLALPSPRRESSASASDIVPIDATGEINEARGILKTRQILVDETVLPIPITCNINHCTAKVSIGTPAVNYTLLVDTGSSNIWIGANQPFVSTSSISTGQTVSVNYGSGQFTGHEVTLAPGLVVQNQSIGVATQSTGFGSLDGVIGFGRINLTLGTLTSSPNSMIPTVIDSLHNQGTITSRTLGILTQPLGLSASTPGVMIVGGTDSSDPTSGDLTSGIALFPNTKSTLGAANERWGLDASIMYGTTSIMSNRPVIIDTGTTDIALANDVFLAYQKATGGIVDEQGLLTITLAQFETLQPLNLTFFQNTYSLSSNAQILARQPDSDSNNITLFVSSLGSSDQTPGAILGASFMKYFYTVLDFDHDLVGIATTQFTNAIVN